MAPTNWLQSRWLQGVLIALLFVARTGCNSSPQVLAIPAEGVQYSVWENGLVAAAIPLQNTSATLPITSVAITNITLSAGTRQVPASFPLSIGTLNPGDVVSLDGRFQFQTIGAGTSYLMTIFGSYTMSGNSHNFALQSTLVPQVPARTAITAQKTTVPKFSPSYNVYPPPSFQETPWVFPPAAIRAPLGMPRNLFPTPPVATKLSSVAMLREDAGFLPAVQPGTTGGNVTFTRNVASGSVQAAPVNPSVGGAIGDVLVLSAGTGVSYSTDHGVTFTSVDLLNVNDPLNSARSSFFPQNDGGLCCNQVIVYAAAPNLFLWLMQYRPTPMTIEGDIGTGPNRLRLAWATPAAVAADFLHAWNWVDLTSATLGIGNDWLDAPDLSSSTSYVYVSADHAIQGRLAASSAAILDAGLAAVNGQGHVHPDRRIFVRLALADLLNAATSTVNVQFMEPVSSGLARNRLVQNSTDGMYWGALPDTSTLTVFAWPDAVAYATPYDIPISDYSNSDYSSLDPDGVSWNTAAPQILGAARSQRYASCAMSPCLKSSLNFAFSAGRNTSAGRPQPYVRVETVDLTNLSLLGEQDIWNSNSAFATPALMALSQDPSDTVALSLAVGGGGSYADNAVGFLGDGLLYQTTQSQATLPSRYGDTFSLRQAQSPETVNGRGWGFSTVGYTVKPGAAGQSCTQTPCLLNTQYVEFGRASMLTPTNP